MKSRPARGEWIEMTASQQATQAAKSRPARGEWIEIESQRNSYALER